MAPPHVRPHRRRTSRRMTRRPQRRRKNRLLTPRTPRKLRKPIQARPLLLRKKPESGKRPIRTRLREAAAPRAPLAPPRLLREANPEPRPRAPGKQTARTPIPLQPRRASQRRALQPILPQAPRRQPGTLPQPVKPKPARQVRENQRTPRTTPAIHPAPRLGIQQTLPLGQTPVIPPARGRRTQPLRRNNRPTLPALLTQHHPRPHRPPATPVTQPAPGPPRSP